MLRGVGAGVGSLYVDGVVGIPSVEKAKVPKGLGFAVSCFSCFLGLLVIWFHVSFVPSFQSSEVYKVQSFHVPVFQRFRIPPHLLWKMLFPYYQVSIPGALEPIDPASKIFKNILNGSSRLPGPCTFQHFRNDDFRKNISPTIFFQI